MERTTLDLRASLQEADPRDQPLPYTPTESDKKLARIAMACLELDRQERNLRDLGLLPKRS
jgi:hypothetical protein